MGLMQLRLELLAWWVGGPRVARSERPWAGGCNPLGIGQIAVAASFSRRLGAAAGGAAAPLFAGQLAGENVVLNLGLDGLLTRDSSVTKAGCGFDAVPGGGAEVFSTAVRATIAERKLTGEEWIRVHREAHQLGIPTNCTMLYGHIESADDRIEHLSMLRSLQDDTGGFLTYIPLAYHTENNELGVELGRVGTATTGFEDLKNIAIGRLFLDNIPHVKTVLGVSNVSFGLPPAARGIVNSVFLYHCTKAGLDLAIVNAEKLERYAEIPAEERPRERLATKGPTALTDAELIANYQQYIGKEVFVRRTIVTAKLAVPYVAVANKIKVEYSAVPGDNREFLTFSVPNGWDDVKRLTNRVLTYNNKDFTFSGWNSDRNECYFVRLVNGMSFVATIR